MTKGRLEAFSDGVVAILITIMVLELKISGDGDWHALRELLPEFLTYVLSFVFLGIYWNNHHHMLHAATRVNGKVLWANMHLLFWLSLVPAVTGWVGQFPESSPAAAVYGAVLLASAFAYLILQTTLVACQGPESKLREALGDDLKGKMSAALYVAAIPLAFVHPWISYAIYVIVALIWLVPDPRIESQLESDRR
jgi:TMEM175 potassium channel family protein